MVFLTPLLSPADLSPVFTMKRKLPNVSTENQSFHDQQMLETSRNTVFQRDSDHFLQESASGATNTPPVGCEWHYNITLIIICQSDSQFWPYYHWSSAALSIQIFRAKLCVTYGNTGCGVFKRGVQIYWILRIGLMGRCQKYQNLTKIWLSKSIFYVKNYPNPSQFLFHWRIWI